MTSTLKNPGCTRGDAGFVLVSGLPVPVVWTRLAQTAKAGQWTLILQDPVTWKAGDAIVIASTGHR